MAELLDYLHHFNLPSVILRLTLACLAGGCAGMGRSLKKQNAGLRTYMLVSLGAALTMLISAYEYEMLTGQWLWAQEYTSLKFDASRYSSNVIAGIGFLAAGTIIGISHQQVSGLTTAIGLFCAAVMGIAAGAGFYEAILLATVVIVVAMELMQNFETFYKRRLRNVDLNVDYDSMDNIGRIMGKVRDTGAQVFDLTIEEPEKDGGPFSAVMSLKLPAGRASHSALLSTLVEMDCVLSVQELIS